MLLRLFHLSVVAIFYYTIWYDLSFINIPLLFKGFSEYPVKGRSTFLTFWCLVIQTIYFTIAVLNDYLGTNVPHPKQSSILRAIKDKLFVLALPTALYVCGAFWAIYNIDRDLVFPDHVAKEFPPWVNHTLHTLIVPFITLELIFTYRQYPSRFVGFSIVSTFNLMYVFWFHCIYFDTGAWVYPIFNVLNWPMRVAFIIASTSLALVLYIVGEKLNSLVWSRVAKQKVKSK